MQRLEHVGLQEIERHRNWGHSLKKKPTTNPAEEKLGDRRYTPKKKNGQKAAQKKNKKKHKNNINHKSAEKEHQVMERKGNFRKRRGDGEFWFKSMLYIGGEAREGGKFRRSGGEGGKKGSKRIWRLVEGEVGAIRRRYTVFRGGKSYKRESKPREKKTPPKSWG